MDSFYGPGKLRWIPVKAAVTIIWYLAMIFRMPPQMLLKLPSAETRSSIIYCTIAGMAYGAALVTTPLLLIMTLPAIYRALRLSTARITLSLKTISATTRWVLSYGRIQKGRRISGTCKKEIPGV